MSETLIPKPFKATCDDCRVEGFDDQEGCEEVACVEAYRMASPRQCTCVEMAPEACAEKVPIEECLCLDGETTKPGYLISGAYIGMTAPVTGNSLLELAAIQAPNIVPPHFYVDFFKSSEGTNLACPITIEDWIPVTMNGETVIEDPLAVPISRNEDTGECIAGAFFLTLEQLGIETLSGGEGEPCIQTGGCDAFALRYRDGNGKLLALCPFPGIRPPVQCDRHLCCDWAIVSGPNLSEDGTDATIELTLTRAEDCECAPPTATLTIDDGDGTPATVYNLTTTPRNITHIVHGYFAGQVVTITLDQVYSEGCAMTCTNSSLPQTVTL